jgi:SnoaL-like domain
MAELLAAAPSLLARLFIALDGHDYDALTDCFAPDGVWLRQGKALSGRGQIRQTLVETKPAIRTTIHQLSNICIDSVSAESGSGRFYLAVYRHDSGSPPPYPVPTPRNLGLCKVDYVLVDKTWLVQRMQTGPYVFTTA